MPTAKHGGMPTIGCTTGQRFCPFPLARDYRSTTQRLRPAAFALAGAGHIGNTFPPLSNWFRLRGVACLLARFVSHIFDRTIGLMAESEGFEPPIRCRIPDFESGAFDHSANSPQGGDCIPADRRSCHAAASMARASPAFYLVVA